MHYCGGYAIQRRGIMLDVVDTPYRGGVLCYRGGVLCLMWWIRHTEAGYFANVVGYYA